MTPIIIDTSGYISLSVETDHNHGVAVARSEALLGEHRPLVVPGEVFAETATVLGRYVSPEQRFLLADDLLTAGVYTVVDTSMDLRTRALAKLRTAPASVSFVDCLVMAYADYYGTKTIFGFDDVFRRNGYESLVGS